MNLIAVSLLDVNVHVTTYDSVVERVLAWSREQRGRLIVFANVHVITEARRRPDLRAALQNADLVNPDGMPLVWSLKALGAPASRVYGPDCMLHLLEACAKENVPIGLYGGLPETLTKLEAVIAAKWPQLQVLYSFSPPFGPYATEAEEVEKMTNSGARVLFVGLGCPKQELWIARHQSQIPIPMLAVGAAFDFIAGTKAQAPRWIMRMGMEWLYRLVTEPRRLLKRYLQSNPIFVLLMVKQILYRRRSGPEPA